MKTYHSPGPWISEIYRDGRGRLSARIRLSGGGDHIEIARIERSGSVSSVQPREIEANAALIAAAPEMVKFVEFVSLLPFTEPTRAEIRAKCFEAIELLTKINS